ncbi:tetratricopeptide repeat protein [Conexibacter woesei]|uniref:tetratricopeptide repeat protein n=1 Tax=Conexibacter woesei TaxID=191495 RepID=UPI00040D500D|nr:O-antigen ligase family protein [Conexibacter woesei]
MSTVAAPPDASILSGRATRERRAFRRPPGETVFGILLAIGLAAVGLRAGGGLLLTPTAKVEIWLDVVGGLCAAIAVLAVRDQRWWGGVTIAWFAALALLTALSITWSIVPSDSWLEANRTIAYLMIFAAAVVGARAVGAWWSAVLGAVCAASTAICAYAILTKVFPGALAAADPYARLREPYQYWNAVGLTAAIGVPPTLWLGARRSGHAALNALAYPIMGLLLLTVLLAYSRGSLLAMAVGLGFWFLVVPLRLRGVAVLACGAVGAVLVALWVFSQDTLTKDQVSVAQRATSGHELGIAVVAMLLVLLAVGLLIGFSAAQRSASEGTRRYAGAAILVCVGLVPMALVIALAMSSKGLGGSISSGWKSLTDPNDKTTVLNDPSRLTSVGSVRARYWDESIRVFRSHPMKGVGAGGYRTARLRLRTDNLDVRHSHGYAVQTAADLGLLGLLVSALLTLSWMVATGRTLGWRIPLPRALALAPKRPPPTPDAAARAAGFGPERVAMATMATVVIVFAVHSFIDWTWFVPGCAVLALVPAGWVAGRGPLGERASDGPMLAASLRRGLRSPVRVGIAALALALGLLTAWTAWLPLGSLHAQNRALTLAATNYKQAIAEVDKAQSRDPLSTDPLLMRALVETTAHHRDAAQRALTDAVRLQPNNPGTWEYLSDFALEQQNDPQLALRLLGPALYLDPQSPTGKAQYLKAFQLLEIQTAAKEKRKAEAKAKREARHRAR